MDTKQADGQIPPPKYDHTVMVIGAQGVGKSTFIERAIKSWDCQPVDFMELEQGVQSKLYAATGLRALMHSRRIGMLCSAEQPGRTSAHHPFRRARLQPPIPRLAADILARRSRRDIWCHIMLRRDPGNHVELFRHLPR